MNNEQRKLLRIIMVFVAFLLVMDLVFFAVKVLDDDGKLVFSKEPINSYVVKELSELTIYNMHEQIENSELGESFISASDVSGIAYSVIVGSPDAVFIPGITGFSGYDANNEVLFELSEGYDMKFMPICAIYPGDNDKLDKIKSCVERGAVGIKLYSGNPLFYEDSLDNSEMYGVYQYCEDNGVPVIWHVNPAADTVRGEFEEVLGDFPGMIVNCPHYCMSSINNTRLEQLMDTYPQLYIDMSFGVNPGPGFKRVSRDPQKFQKLFDKYQDRILFSTAFVVEDSGVKDVTWMAGVITCYRDMLEKESYECKVGNDINDEFFGLNLSLEILNKVYQDNAENFLDARFG